MRLTLRLQKFAALLFLFAALSPARAAEREDRERLHSFGLGLAFTGVVVRKGLPRDFALESRYLFGFAGSNADDATAHAFGLRAYRHFRTDKRLQIYGGLEGNYVMAETRIQKSNGYSAGGFAGVEYYLSRRFSLTLDLGPQYIWIKEKDLGTSDGGVDFVMNTSINFYIY